jgi:hypothetical protein
MEKISYERTKYMTFPNFQMTFADLHNSEGDFEYIILNVKTYIRLDESDSYQPEIVDFYFRQFQCRNDEEVAMIMKEIRREVKSYRKNVIPSERSLKVVYDG